MLKAASARAAAAGLANNMGLSHVVSVKPTGGGTTGVATGTGTPASLPPNTLGSAAGVSGLPTPLVGSPGNATGVGAAAVAATLAINAAGGKPGEAQVA